ncbi:MAG: hypothetical protein K8963_04130 [Proteobacteria bacterium]|nr:hypothetical protein [Pseudomonadota bacterium]
MKPQACVAVAIVGAPTWARLHRCDDCAGRLGRKQGGKLTARWMATVSLGSGVSGGCWREWVTAVSLGSGVSGGLAARWMATVSLVSGVSSTVAGEACDSGLGDSE